MPEAQPEITGEFPCHHSCDPHQITIHCYNPETRELAVEIDGEITRLPVATNQFSPVTLANRHVGFPAIEHPIRDDLEHSNSIIRALLKQALEPHGITVTNDR